LRLTCAGAARTVTGSCHHLAVGDLELLIDCGLFQGGAELEARNRRPFPFAAAALDHVLITHGHLDHVGRLPLLVKAGYAGSFHATPATCEVAAIILRDSAKIQEEDHARDLHKAVRAGRESELPGPLYTSADAERAIERFKPIKYDRPLTLGQDVVVTYRQAGHILGSAYLEIEAEGGRITFSGDLGNRESSLHVPAVPPRGSDIVVLESTYGDRNHRTRAATTAEFLAVVKGAVARGGNVMIPTFAVERAQQVLYELYSLISEGALADLPVYLDSPMATSVTKLYQRGVAELRPEVARVFEAGGDPFDPPSLTFTPDAEASKKLNDVHGGAVIIAASGMMTGGRILHHLKHNLWREQASLVIVGYQAQGTLGRALIHGAKRVRIHGDEIAVRASIHTINGFSAHADRDDLLEFLSASHGAQVLLVHGEEPVMESFAAVVEAAGSRTTLPEMDRPIDL